MHEVASITADARAEPWWHLLASAKSRRHRTTVHCDTGKVHTGSSRGLLQRTAQWTHAPHPPAGSGQPSARRPRSPLGDFRGGMFHSARWAGLGWRHWPPGPGGLSLLLMIVGPNPADGVSQRWGRFCSRPTRTQAFRSYLSSTWYERVGSARASLRLVAIGFGDANLALRAAASNYRRDEPRWMDGGRPSPRDAFCLLLPSPVLMAAFSARPLRPVKTPIAQRLLAADVTRILPSPQRPSPHPHVCQDTCAIRRHLLAATPPSPAALPRSEAGPSDSLLRSSPPCVAGRLARTRRLRDEPRGPPETPSGVPHHATETRRDTNDTAAGRLGSSHQGAAALSKAKPPQSTRRAREDPRTQYPGAPFRPVVIACACEEPLRPSLSSTDAAPSSSLFFAIAPTPGPGPARLRHRRRPFCSFGLVSPAAARVVLQRAAILAVRFDEIPSLRQSGKPPSRCLRPGTGTAAIQLRDKHWPSPAHGEPAGRATPRSFVLFLSHIPRHLTESLRE
ncbi:hypothetical protein PCL_08102 [Purpureocillium lilacinum]|uniref:Uncharacterized protein n=1 Tax=Purpureocillium lilacinum TaxID=33203 RepID=A0A2U3EJU3_PURLI|nr:hypothetical protein PCL_08102 [Purpureocillium lilacinum]